MKSQDLQNYFATRIGKTFPYWCAFDYPHGRMTAITPYQFDKEEKGHRRAQVRAYITFTDGWKGDYTLDAHALYLFLEA